MWVGCKDLPYQNWKSGMLCPGLKTAMCNLQLGHSRKALGYCGG